MYSVFKIFPCLKVPLGAVGALTVFRVIADNEPLLIFIMEYANKYKKPGMVICLPEMVTYDGSFLFAS